MLRETRKRIKLTNSRITNITMITSWYQLSQWHFTNCPLFHRWAVFSCIIRESTVFPQFMTKLTAAQCSDLIEQYVELCIDSMDHKSMYHFIEQTLIEDFENLSEEELFTEIECSFDKELLNELVDNVTTVTYGLEEGESITFPVHKK